MICDKCKKDFPENEIEDSHDIPKYLGGEDKDGRHWLCNKCHEEYDLEILRKGLMMYIKTLPERNKVVFRRAVKIVQKYFFKGDKNK